MNWYTKVTTEKSNWKISHKDKVMLFGSCFTDSIGEKFLQNGFDIIKNPLGILYNPLSISVCLNRTAELSYLEKNDLIFNNEFWYAFSFHGDYRGKTQDECLTTINNRIREAHDFLKTTSVVIITLGSAWTYWYKPSNYLMGNCHKIDSKLIERRMLSIHQIAECIKESMDLIYSKFNNDMHFILTISPIRHWREGFRDNTISKSSLHLAINEIMKENNHIINYFPSFEIMMDELRDYRFYEKDMLHPNSVAIDYIWDRFCDDYFTSETINTMSLYNKLFLMQNHIPINPDSDAYRHHKEKIEKLKQVIDRI